MAGPHLKLIPNPAGIAPVCGLSADQITGLSKNLIAVLPSELQLVQFSPTQPFDKSRPWQELNASGAPVGSIKYYEHGKWEPADASVSSTGTTTGTMAGPRGPVGPTGPAGPRGFTGAPGLNGTNGNDGAAGATGPRGLQGNLGPAGPLGPTGATGATGLQGPEGPAGPAGPAGYQLQGGTSIPDNSVGSDNDWYLQFDTDYNVVAAYGPKANGAWPPPAKFLTPVTDGSTFSGTPQGSSFNLTGAQIGFTHWVSLVNGDVTLSLPVNVASGSEMWFAFDNPNGNTLSLSGAIAGPGAFSMSTPLVEPEMIGYRFNFNEWRLIKAPATL